MTDAELKQELESIRSNMKYFDDIVHHDISTGEVTITSSQGKIVQKLLDLFGRLNWQLSLNSYKQLNYDNDTPVIRKRGCGTPVKVRSCKDEHGDKTYFGILIGDLPISISHSIDNEGNITAKRSFYNPAIFIPELNDIVLGCESWWGEIENEDELNNLITEETISNVWYMKILKNMGVKNDDGDTDTNEKKGTETDPS